MRKKKKFVVNGKAYSICELSVNDVFALYYTFDSIEMEDARGLFSNLLESIPLLESVTTCPWKVLVNLGTSELKNIYELFLELNSFFFKKRKEKSKGKEVKIEEFVENVFFLYCNLTEAGHTGVLNYGYSFFIKAINNHERIKCSKIADGAMAARMAYHGDKNQWKKYIRDLIKA
ncbi:MAG: hypothetical protein KAS32_30520 [Candidatus Peribacteraceae bacterium]|nr:hypothetical protein [Candidatus Peribacteraceae bacterium]